MKKDKKMTGCALFGLLIVAIGVLFLAINLGWLDSGLRQIVFSWPMIFIAFAIISLTPLSMRSYWQTALWTVLGVFFLLPRIASIYPEMLPGIDGDFARNYWPVLLILVGLGIVISIFFGRKKFFLFGFATNTFPENGDCKVAFNKVEGTDGIYARTVVFGGQDDIFLEPVFRGGNIEVAFGGVELDLRKTTLPEGDTRLNIEVAFGGLELHLPEDWVVVSRAATAFGAIEHNRSQVMQSDQTRRLIITGHVAFSGVEIR